MPMYHGMNSRSVVFDFELQLCERRGRLDIRAGACDRTLLACGSSVGTG